MCGFWISEGLIIFVLGENNFHHMSSLMVAILIWPIVLSASWLECALLRLELIMVKKIYTKRS